MLELWAKRRETKKFEYITSFEDENQKFYLMDCLDDSIYQEAMVLRGEQCIMYSEFLKPYKKLLRKK